LRKVDRCHNMEDNGETEEPVFVMSPRAPLGGPPSAPADLFSAVDLPNPTGGAADGGSSYSKTDAAHAFSAAEIASAATAAVVSLGASPEQLSARLVDTALPMHDRLAACHRLNEYFAATRSLEEAVCLSSKLVSQRPTLGDALVALMVDGDVLVELAVQLMHNISLHPDGTKILVQAGALPILAASLRANEPLLRAHGLSLLAALAERAELAAPLARAGVVKLVSFLARSPGADAHWPLLLEICDGMLRVPRAVPEAQRKLLRGALDKAGAAYRAKELHLDPPDARRLARLMLMLCAFAGTPPAPGGRPAPNAIAKSNISTVV
jgi:hypothetical protein